MNETQNGDDAMTTTLTIPSERTIRRHLAALRVLVERSPDPMISRIAQAMEAAIQWSRFPTAGWPSMEHEANLMAQILGDDLMREKTP